MDLPARQIKVERFIFLDFQVDVHPTLRNHLGNPCIQLQVSTVDFIQETFGLEDSRHFE
jgi:hypothetical protein